MTAGNPRLWAILTVAAGLAVVSLMVVFATLPEVKAAQAASCFGAGAAPVVEFEFARTMADLARIFGPSGGACEAPVVAAMDAINRIDLPGYIPAYSLFGIFGAIFAARGGRPRLVLLAILVMIAAAVADVVETTTLLAITQRLDTAEPLLPRASNAAWIKFFALSLHAALVAAVCLRTRPRRRILGLLLIPAAVGTAVAAVDTARFIPVMNIGFAIGWSALLLLALKEAILPPKAAG